MDSAVIKEGSFGQRLPLDMVSMKLNREVLSDRQESHRLGIQEIFLGML